MFLKVKSFLTGDGSDENPFRPSVFDYYPKGKWHLMSDQMVTTRPSVIVWLDMEKSPIQTVTAVKGANPEKGIVSVLGEFPKEEVPGLI